MCSRFSILVLVAACGAPSPETLRVCADPNNLPFSNERGEGFENALAQLVAKDLGRTVEYTWMPQRRGFIRNTLKAQKCDVVMGEPVGFDMARVTRPYYRSTYVFVSRADRALGVKSLDDPRLARMRIGLHAIGDDYANVPPAQALARRGLVEQVRGFPIYGDYTQPNPPADLITAVADGEVDVAIAWGPLAGYFARKSPVPLTVTPIESSEPGMTFAIGLAVRKDDSVRAAALASILADEQAAIDRVLDQFGVPRLPLENI